MALFAFELSSGPFVLWACVGLVLGALIPPVALGGVLPRSILGAVFGGLVIFLAMGADHVPFVRFELASGGAMLCVTAIVAAGALAGYLAFRQPVASTSTAGAPNRGASKSRRVLGRPLLVRKDLVTLTVASIALLLVGHFPEVASHFLWDVPVSIANWLRSQELNLAISLLCVTFVISGQEIRRSAASGLSMRAVVYLALAPALTMLTYCLYWLLHNPQPLAQFWSIPAASTDWVVLLAATIIFDGLVAAWLAWRKVIQDRDWIVVFWLGILGCQMLCVLVVLWVTTGAAWYMD